MLTLDGRTGEGGGQLVRVAAALAALTGQPLRVINVRGNRRSGGGLKPQHVAALDWLAAATHATVAGVAPGSTAFTLKPKHVLLPHNTSPDSPIVLRAATPAASTSLMLQAVLPYLLFASPAARPGTAASSAAAASPVSVDLCGGTHVSFAPTFDYLDQVLFPTLEAWFGVRVERELVRRGWSTGPAHAEAGLVRLVVHPLHQSELVSRMPSLCAPGPRPSRPVVVAAIDATVLAPQDLLDPLAGALAREVAQCAVLSPDPAALTVDLQFRTLEESGHDSRVYVLLVARTSEDEDADGQKLPMRRWGRDYLGTATIKRGGGGGGRPNGGKIKGKKGGKAASATTSTASSSTTSAGFGPLCDRIARRVVRDLADDVRRGGCGDAHLQDQVVVFQALAAGRTSFWREEAAAGKEEATKEKTSGEVNALQHAVEQLDLGGVDTASTDEQKAEDRTDDPPDDMSAPFGQGSLHAATARWVTASLLPAVRWSAGGTVCDGVGWTRGGK